MCKEDIRLARAASPGRATSAVPTGTPAKVIGANAERYALMASLGTGVAITSSFAVTVFAVIGGLRFPLIGLSIDHPTGVVSLTDVGAALLGDIWIEATDTAATVTVYVAETAWDKSQEQI